MCVRMTLTLKKKKKQPNNTSKSFHSLSKQGQNNPKIRKLKIGPNIVSVTFNVYYLEAVQPKHRVLIINGHLDYPIFVSLRMYRKMD